MDALLCQQEQVGLPDLLKLWNFSTNREIFAWIYNHAVSVNPFHQSGMLQPGFLEAGQCFSINPSSRVTMVVIDAVVTHPRIRWLAFDPAEAHLFVIAPVIGASVQLCIVDRMPVFRAVHLGIFVILSEIPARCPKFPDHKAIWPGLDQVHADFIRIKMPAQSPNCLVDDFVAAA